LRLEHEARPNAGAHYPRATAGKTDKRRPRVKD
jgi:hypothetical protein